MRPSPKATSCGATTANFPPPPAGSIEDESSAIARMPSRVGSTMRPTALMSTISS